MTNVQWQEIKVNHSVNAQSENSGGLTWEGVSQAANVWGDFARLTGGKDFFSVYP